MDNKKFLSVFYPPGAGGNFVYLTEKGFEIEDWMFSKTLDLHRATGQYFHDNFYEGWNVSNNEVSAKEPKHDMLSHKIPTNLLSTNHWKNHHRVFILIEPKDVLLCSWLCHHKADIQSSPLLIKALKNEANLKILHRLKYSEYSTEATVFRFMFNLDGITKYLPLDTNVKFDKIVKFDSIWNTPTDDSNINFYRSKHSQLIDYMFPWIEKRLDIFYKYSHLPRCQHFIKYYRLALDHYG